MPKASPLVFFLMFSAVGSTLAEPLSHQQPSAQEMAAKLGIGLPRLPWHLTDIWWRFENPTANFESLEVDVTIDRDIPESYNLYISPVGIAKINGLQFYGGLQTNVNGWASKKSRTRVHPGRGAIFSRWSHDLKQPIGLSHVRTVKGGLCESAGYEGQFCSVRRTYAWKAGTYTYSIVKGDLELIKEQPHTWFHCLVRSHKSDFTTYMGSLRFEGEDFTFWDRNAAFVEIYATSKIPKSGIPKVSVTFGYPRLNGKAPSLKSAYAYYNSEKSPQCAKTSVDVDKVVVEVGSMFLPDKKGVRHQPLVIKSP